MSANPAQAVLLRSPRLPCSSAQALSLLAAAEAICGPYEWGVYDLVRCQGPPALRLLLLVVLCSVLLSLLTCPHDCCAAVPSSQLPLR